MNRTTTLLLTALALLSLTACGEQPRQAQPTPHPLYSDREILTTEDLNDGRMVIVVDTQYNVSTTDIERVIETRFPEVNVVLRLQNTPDSPYQTQKALEYNQLGDIFFNVTGLTKDESQLSRYFIDLSSAPFINQYYQNALDGVAVNGKIYMLPGFSDLFGIVYDRTLFEEQGWTLPQSRTEFTALCQTIRETMGYQAFLPTLRYGRMAMLFSHAFHYQQVIQGADHLKWQQDCRNGKAGFTGHMEPMFEGMKELYDAGVVSDLSFEIEAGLRSTMLYKEHTTAMTMETQNAATYAANANSDHEFGMMPFWNSDLPDSDFVVSARGFNIYANKELEKPENAEKLDKVMEILAYISTPEGQRALMSQESATISNVKGTDGMSGGAFMDGVAGTISKGNIFQEVRYTDLPNNNPFQVAFREALIGYLHGTMSIEEAMACCDEALQALQTAEPPVESVYGRALQTFTVLETAEYVADILRETASADLALVLTQKLSYGETGNFFEGDITDTMLRFVTLDYVSGREPSYNQLVTVRLTGAQIRQILNYPYLDTPSTVDPSALIGTGVPSYWTPSNLKLEYAPLLPEGRVVSISNMDGSPFDLEKTYRVALWNGSLTNMKETDYFDRDTLAAMADVAPVTEVSSEELIQAAIERAGEISPPDDGRFTIRWDIKPET